MIWIHLCIWLPMSCFQQTLHDITLHGSPDLIFMLCISKKRTREFITSANSISVGAYSKNIPRVDVIPAWIRIQVIPIPALLDAIPAPHPDPQKSGIVTPLRRAHLRTFPSRVSFVLVGRCACAHTRARRVTASVAERSSSWRDVLVAALALLERSLVP